MLSALCEDPPLYFCDQRLFEQSIMAGVFPILEAAMRSAQAEGKPREFFESMVADAVMPWGRAGDHMSARALQSRVDAMMLGDPDVWLPAIHGGALSGYDPDARVDQTDDHPAGRPARWARRSSPITPRANTNVNPGDRHPTDRRRAARDSLVPRLDASDTSKRCATSSSRAS